MPEFATTSPLSDATVIEGSLQIRPLSDQVGVHSHDG